jgi:hypothetical protein
VSVQAPAPSASAVAADAGSDEPADAGEADAALAPNVLVTPLDFAPTKGSKFKPMKLKSDGTIAYPDKVIAKLEADKLSDDDGSAIAEFAAEGKILIGGVESKFKFNEQNELLGDNGFKIAVADDGTPTIIEKANTPPEKLTGKFVDFDPKTRRAAVVMLGLHDLKKAAKKAAKAAKAAKDGGAPNSHNADHAKKKNKKNKKNKKK